MTVNDSCSLPDDLFWIWIDDILYNVGEDPADYDPDPNDLPDPDQA